MDILSSLNLEQLGTAGIFIVYLIWKNAKLEEELSKAIERSFSTMKEASDNALENSRTLEKVISALGGQ